MRAYKSDLEGLDLFCATAVGVLEHQAAAYLNIMRREWSPRTTCRKLASFRAYGQWLGQPGFLATYKPPVPSVSQPHPIPEGIDGVVRMIETSRNGVHRCLLALNGLLGLRVAEAIEVRPEHFDLIEMTLSIRGKGDKTRVIPVSTRAWEYIRDQYTYCTQVAPGQRLVPYSNRGARKMVTTRARRAGLSRPVASHDMRATTLTAAYNKSHDIRAVQELAGHADIKTTQVYTGVTMAAMREAVDL